MFLFPPLSSGGCRQKYDYSLWKTGKRENFSLWKKGTGKYLFFFDDLFPL